MAKKKEWEIPPSLIKGLDKQDFETTADKLKSINEYRYLDTVETIVNESVQQLESQNKNKESLRNRFFPLFKGLIIAQLVFIIVVVLLQGFCFTCFEINTTVLVAIISSVFVETLGVIGIMIKFCFDSKQEVNILQILNGVVEHFQKRNDEQSNKDKK